MERTKADKMLYPKTISWLLFTVTLIFVWCVALLWCVLSALSPMVR